MPMVPARLAPAAVHALLDDGPMAVVRHDEAMQVKLKAVLHCGAVDFRNEAARTGERLRVDADTVAECSEFRRGLARVPAAATAYVDTDLALERRQAALQRADDARRDARGMPVHSHNGAEGLEPERMRKAPQEF